VEKSVMRLLFASRNYTSSLATDAKQGQPAKRSANRSWCGKSDLKIR